MTVSWLKRRRYEAQIQAVEVVNALGIAMGGETGNQGEKRTSGDAMMNKLGVSF